MAFNAPPWTPDMDQRSAAEYDRLAREKYNGHIDPLGDVRWSSDWRMHVGNKCDDDEAHRRICVNIDQIRAGQTPTKWPKGVYDVPWSPSLETPWPPPNESKNDVTDFRERLDALYMKHQGRPVDPVGIFRWSSDYRISRANNLSHASAWNKIEYEILDIWGVTPPAGECQRPLLDVQRNGNLFFLHGKSCTPELSSEFVYARVKQENPDMAARLLDDIVRTLKQGSRQFTVVGGWAALPTDFWFGRGIYPVPFTPWQFDRKDGHLRPKTDANGVPMYGPRIEAWPNYDDVMVGCFEDALRRKLVLHLTTGDAQIIFADIASDGWPRYNFDKEMAHHQRICRLLKQTDARVGKFYEIRNEVPMNSPEGGSAKDWEDCRKIAREVQQQLGSSVVIVGLGAALDIHPDALHKSTDGFDCSFVHVQRDWPTCLKYTLSLRYQEGQWGNMPWPFMHGEPLPMNIPPYGDGIGDDGYMATDRVDRLIAVHTMCAITSQGHNVFTGAGVLLETYPSLMPGYREISEIIAAHIPEDIAGWHREHGPGGAILYFTEGAKFVTSTDETWDTTPPRSVKSWTMYTGTGAQIEVLSGTGAPPNDRTGFIVGEFQQ